jgi:5-amino-6-(5-phosphoribosylamino)uracil reductase
MDVVAPPADAGRLARPYVLLSAAVSLDGYLDDAGPRRLLLSSEADLDAVDDIRAGVDAIMVGANTVRRDDPVLMVRSPKRRAARISRGEPSSPMKVTLTGTGRLPPSARFFTTGDVARLVYVPADARAQAQARLGGSAQVIALGHTVELAQLLADLHDRGVRRLLVEGGAQVLAQFLRGRLADELRVGVAPVLVADAGCPRLVPDGANPWSPQERAELLEVSRLGDVAVLRYALGPGRAG